ncbi:MAG: PLP-dependent transferase [Clostridia bacterium]|nr:PLP-dependent transferase [Clostridia bacterium]
MKTPICDFVKDYAARGASRFHMPGHKGEPFLGCEPLDITEICGADTLYSANGIIAESEESATRVFGTAHTFYSAEGSTLAIKAMLALVVRGVARGAQRPLILASRCVHKAFVYAAALLDLDVEWIYPEDATHICKGTVTASSLATALASGPKPAAVYITSPDYLGNVSDISALSEICHAHHVPLLVDNAHGAYLHFLTPSRHPIALGADLCCDSAHKTLPVLTGGAYLHVSKHADPTYVAAARSTLAIFASTSPSYLILQSLDRCNAYLSCGYAQRLADTVARLNALKTKLRALGVAVTDTEPLKLVIDAPASGYTGVELAEHLRAYAIEVEFADWDYVVLMVTPENRDTDFARVAEAFECLPKRAPLQERAELPSPRAKRVLSIRAAVFAAHESCAARDAVGKITATPTVSCPPAVPIAVSGERIGAETVRLLEHYGIDRIEVVKA